MNSIIKALILIFLICQNSYADEAYSRKLIDRITALTGAASVQMTAPFVESYSAGLADSLFKMKPVLPPEAKIVIQDEIRIYLYDQLLINKEMNSLKYVVYQRYFTEKELEELVKFYESPIGEKLIWVTPQLMEDIQKESQKVISSIEKNLIDNIGPRLNKRMRENGW